MKQRIALLGSTGSIGVQTLDIVRENSELFEITTLTAHRNWEALARQAEEFAPDYGGHRRRNSNIRRRCADALADRPVKVYAGSRRDPDRSCRLGHRSTRWSTRWWDTAGLLPDGRPRIEARQESRAGQQGDASSWAASYVMQAGRRATGLPILPIDSEHSAIFQCLVGEAFARRGG